MNTKKIYVLVILLIALALIVSIVLVGCSNKQMFDFNLKFEYAYVRWPDGTSEKLKINSWKDYEGEQIQISTDEGTYLFNSVNCVLAHE